MASALIPVSEALARVLASIPEPVGEEDVAIADAAHRTLARDIVAARNQPPFAASAMDGYAVRSADIGAVPQPLTVIGDSAAGRGFRGSVGPGQAVRILTGAPLPPGADTIVIQEDTERTDDRVVIHDSAAPG
ncbi:MAG: molybdenum cofactor synthesis domain protein, partial [Enterovirga sp.]|nr:molybdenum cofactor synthesis domain protein [Enterovirga sp.]